MLDPVLQRLYATTDASVWAGEFCRIAKEQGHDLDEGWMIGWFANAIETAKTHASKEASAFKTYVHKRLDDAGVPTHPDGPHSKEGCRIGDRLDLVLPAHFDCSAETS